MLSGYLELFQRVSGVKTLSAASMARPLGSGTAVLVAGSRSLKLLFGS